MKHASRSTWSRHKSQTSRRSLLTHEEFVKAVSHSVRAHTFTDIYCGVY